MGLKVANEVKAYSASRDNDRNVLMVLALMANDETRECWPSMDSIAWGANLAERNARMRIRALEAMGEIVVIRNGGRSDSRGGLRSNCYCLTVYLDDDGEPLPGVRVRPKRIRTPASGPTLTPASGRMGTPASAEVLVEEQGEVLTRCSPFDNDFDQLWQLYPRRIDGGRARNAYRARRREGVSAEDMLAATKNYAAAMVGTEPRYIKYAANFFGPTRPFEDWVNGVPQGAARSSTGRSQSMTNFDRVLASVGGPAAGELTA